MKKETFDTIIIGSGVSGMAAAIILANEGEKVLVLEQHAILGGLTQTFKRAGLVFPSGVHRLGSLSPGQPLWYFFNYLGLMERLEFVPLSQEGFESYYFPGTCFRVPQGHGAYKARLISKFPDQAGAITQYFNDMSSLVDGLELYNPIKTHNPDRSREFTGALDDYFSSMGIQGQLKSILSANSPLYGLPAAQCPVLTHFLVSDTYLNSSFRINETATPFSKALADSLTAAGGKLATQSRVAKILVKDRVVQGVELENKENFKAARVIFSGHPALLPALCPPKTFRPVYQNRLESVENTPGMFGVGLKWKKKNCPVADNDAYIYDRWDSAVHYRQENGLKNRFGIIFLTAMPDNRPGQCGIGEDTLGVTALTTLSPQDLKEIDTWYGHPRTKEYKEIKKRLAKEIMDQIEKTFPNVRAEAEIVDTYSPATFERYTLTPGGSAYGIKKTAQAFLQGMFSPATRVKGLFLTGQSVGFSGIHGAVSTSVNLCSHFYPKSYLMDKIRRKGKQNQ